ncbi:MAG: diguanylate cyclase domain-containing protein [Patescibacteria group bacterium]
MANESLLSVERIKLTQEKQALEQKILQLKRAILAEADPVKKSNLELDLAIAEQDKETLEWSTDATGALKGDRFGVELRELMEEQGLRRDEQGELVCDNERALESTQLIMVNMGELDRLNESGEHALGDEGLGLAYKKINETVVAILRQRPGYEDMDPTDLLDKFKVYRTAGNDFTIVIKNGDEKLSRSIADALTGGMELPAEMNQEDVPLAAASLSLGESVGLLKHLRNAQGHEVAGENDREEVASQDKTDMITLLKERLVTLSEQSKVQTRLQRMIDKIKNPQADEKINAKDLYDKFLQKSLGGVLLEEGEVGPQSYEVFAAALERNGLLEDGDDAIQRRQRHRIMDIASNVALRQFQVYNENTVYAEKKLQESVLGDLQERMAGEGVESKLKIKELKPAARAEYGDDERREVREFQGRLDQLGGSTEGAKIIAELRAGLKEEQQKKPQNAKAIELAQKKLNNELLKRDPLTGLKGRGLYYQNLEAKINNGEPVSVVAIDMAFLKYFDKVGGKNTGDRAIVAAGIILDHVAKKFVKYGVEAFRLGGDEFSLSANTDDKEVLNDIISEIKYIAENQVENIPVHEGATTDYRPESLQFNFGVAVYDQKKHGIESAHRRDRKTPADKLNHEADSRIEIDKAVNRFIFLLHRSIQIKRLPEEKSKKVQKELKLLMSFSEKAIFGQIGRDAIRDWTAEYQAGSVGLRQIMEELQKLIMEQLKEKGKKEIQDMEVMHVMLENQLLLDFNRAVIQNLMGEIQELEKSKNTYKEQIESLQERLRLLQEDQRAVLSLRQKMKKAA